MHARILLHVGVHIRFRLVRVDTDILRQREGGDTVHDAEIYGLRAASERRRDLFYRDVEHAGGRNGVEVLAAQERLLHRLVARYVRQQAQFYLTVIRVDEHLSRRGDKHPAYLGAELTAHGDVLQIRFCGRQASRGRDGHLEACVDPAVG